MLLECTITHHISCFWTAPSHNTCHANGLHYHTPHIMLMDCTITRHISCFWTAPSHATYHASGLHHHTPHIMLLDCTITCHICFWTATSHATYCVSELHHHTPHIVLLNYTIIVIPPIIIYIQCSEFHENVKEIGLSKCRYKYVIFMYHHCHIDIYPTPETLLPTESYKLQSKYGYMCLE